MDRSGFSDTQRGEGDRGRWTGLGVSDTQRGEGIGGDGQVWGSVTPREGRG